MNLKAFKAQACQQLKEERSKSLTLLQKRESGPAKSEADLLQRIQELTLKLQQSETLVKVMGSGSTRNFSPPNRLPLLSAATDLPSHTLTATCCLGQMVQARAQELEVAQVRAEDRVSKHKEATQLLQTELQDVCAQLKERENSIQSLKEQLQESEVGHSRVASPRPPRFCLSVALRLSCECSLMSFSLGAQAQVKRGMAPSAVELEEMKNKLIKMQLEGTACASTHQEE